MVMAINMKAVHLQEHLDAECPMLPLLTPNPVPPPPPNIPPRELGAGDPTARRRLFLNGRTGIPAPKAVLYLKKYNLILKII